VVLASASVVVIVVLVFSLNQGSGTPSLDISFDQIAKIQAYPVPEGSPPPPLEATSNQGSAGTTLSEVQSDIPSPFPAPKVCDYPGFGDGLQLSVWLRDGRRLDYFACAFPDELQALYSDAWR
jgi:hypothetical protein